MLVGHSDGASIALLHAGAGHDVAALVLLAPHVFVEDVSVTSIAGAREAFATTDLRERLGRYHDDPEATFRGWNDVWLSPAFRAWNIEDRLPAITAPVLLVQGADDPYGTTAQLDAIAAGVHGPVERAGAARRRPRAAPRGAGRGRRHGGRLPPSADLSAAAAPLDGRRSGPTYGRMSAVRPAAADRRRRRRSGDGGGSPRRR